MNPFDPPITYLSNQSALSFNDYKLFINQPSSLRYIKDERYLFHPIYDRDFSIFSLHDTLFSMSNLSSSTNNSANNQFNKFYFSSYHFIDEKVPSMPSHDLSSFHSFKNLIGIHSGSYTCTYENHSSSEFNAHFSFFTAHLEASF